MKTTITLKSEVFGNEKFEYDTLKDGQDGFDRLLKSCKTFYKKDKVVRDLELKGSNGVLYHEAQINETIFENEP